MPAPIATQNSSGAKFMGVDADSVENNPEIEQQWAVKAFHHADTFYALLVALKDPVKLRLTPIDDELYSEFRAEFPTLDVSLLKEEADFKSPAAKAKWRAFIMRYEKRVEDYNFGTLLRVDPAGHYTQENTMFATRVQFLVVELARCREGMNKNLLPEE